MKVNLAVVGVVEGIEDPERRWTRTEGVPRPRAALGVDQVLAFSRNSITSSWRPGIASIVTRKPNTCLAFMFRLRCTPNGFRITAQP
ncbi:hypothetical protein ACFQWH_05115 [Mycolicibacterium sp. GCM10028919]|uniref:hypothetical protein n=1 Tax=Mycolicibacterium sp. GCM10028919 TaxID=3273401 RepID=UPI00361B222A